MTWVELTKRVSDRSGESRATAQRVMEALLEEISGELASGGTVNLPRVGRLSSVWRAPRTLRSVEDGRKRMLDGRYAPRFRPATALKERLATRTPQYWRSPEHQAAFRVAETLIGDLALYHGDLAPKDLSADLPPEETEARCAASFGSHWEQVRSTFTSRAPGVSAPLLGLVAHRRWAAR